MSKEYCDREAWEGVHVASLLRAPSLLHRIAMSNVTSILPNKYWPNSNILSNKRQ